MLRSSLTAVSLVSSIHQRSSNATSLNPSFSYPQDTIHRHFPFINSGISSEMISPANECTGNTARETDIYNARSQTSEKRADNCERIFSYESHIRMAGYAVSGNVSLHQVFISPDEEVEVVNKKKKKSNTGFVRKEQRSSDLITKPLYGGGKKGGKNNKKHVCAIVSQNATTDASKKPVAKLESQKIVLRRLYRQCLRMCRRWTPEEETYVRLIHDVDELLRPSLRHLIASARPISTAYHSGYSCAVGRSDKQQTEKPLSISQILRKTFEFKLPTDTEQITDWCLHAGFAFIRRCNNGAEERHLLSSWTHVNDTTFTPLDAAILMSYIHYWFEKPIQITIASEPSASARIWSPFSSAQTIMESLVPDPNSPFNLEVLEERYRLQAPADSSSMIANNKHNISSGVGIDDKWSTCKSRINMGSDDMNHFHKTTTELMPINTNKGCTKRSINSFSEEILIEMERLVESCRSTIPSEELSNTDRYAKIIARSVLHHLRFDENIVAYRNFQTSASASSLHHVLRDRFGSERTIGAVYIHILSALGLRAVQLASVDLPLVCIYSTKSKGKLQFCVDLANTTVLGPTEALDAIKEMYTRCLLQLHEETESECSSESESNEDDCEFLSTSSNVSSDVSTSPLTVDPETQKRFIKDLLTVSESIPLSCIQMLMAVSEDYEISPKEQAMYESAQEFVRRLGLEVE